jgi:hypothetical protein
VIMPASSSFWSCLAADVGSFLSGVVPSHQFVENFYSLVERVPLESDPLLRAAFEKFHYVVANFEPDADLWELGLLDEEILRIEARLLLESILDTGVAPEEGAMRDAKD